MRRTHLLATMVATMLVVASLPAPAHALAATDRFEGRIAAVDDESASFTGGNVSVTRGDRVRISVRHSGPANVTLGGPGYGYHLLIRLRGSGTDEIAIDTYATTNPNPDLYVSGGDATLLSRPIDDPLEPGNYLLRVEVGGVERDIATLTVEPRAEMRARTLVAPGEFEPDEVGTDVDGNANLGPLLRVASARETVARGDYAVVRIEESGLETALNTSDLSGGAAANGVKLSFTQTAPGPNREPTSYVAHGEGATRANVTVLRAFDRDLLYVLWDTSDVPLSTHPERNRYVARLTLTEENALVDEETVVASTPVRVVRAEATLRPATDLVHRSWENDTYVVRGTTTRAPNSTLEVRLRSPDPSAFLQIRTATVDGDGRFEASFDLGGVTRGTNATMWVRGHYRETVQELAILAPHPRITFEPQTVREGPALTVARAVIPGGGFVRLVDERGAAVGRSAYLEPGRHENVTVRLSTPLYEAQTVRAELVADRNGDERYDARNDTAYLFEGSVVNDAARVEFPSARTPTPTLAPTATATPTATPYPVRRETALAPVSPSASKSSVPLPLSVPVAAFLVAALLAARRRRNR
jgi:hypothetical protein